MEIFKPIPGFPGYQVSNLGNVKSFRRYPDGRLLKPYVTSGYHSVKLCIDGVVTPRTVHSLVMLAFVGPPPDSLEVMHADHCRTNNVLTNLSYGTRSQNCSDRPRYRVGNAKLTIEDATYIRFMHFKLGVQKATLAREFSVGKSTVGDLLAGNTWAG